MARTVTVEMDEKGWVHIPVTVRREVKARRFTLSLVEGRIWMDPVKSPALVKGKYKGLLNVTMEELEEAQERLVDAGLKSHRQRVLAGAFGVDKGRLRPFRDEEMGEDR